MPVVGRDCVYPRDIKIVHSGSHVWKKSFGGLWDVSLAWHVGEAGLWISKTGYVCACVLGGGGDQSCYLAICRHPLIITD